MEDTTVQSPRQLFTSCLKRYLLYRDHILFHFFTEFSLFWKVTEKYEKKSRYRILLESQRLNREHKIYPDVCLTTSHVSELK